MPIFFAALGGFFWVALLIVVLVIHGLARALGTTVESVCIALAALLIAIHLRGVLTDMTRTVRGQQAVGHNVDASVRKSIVAALVLWMIWGVDHAGTGFIHWLNPPGHHVEMVFPPEILQHATPPPGPS